MRPYVTQATLASFALLAILLIEQGVTDGIIVVTIAASTATVFVVPHSIASSPKRVIGGHVGGVLVGLALWGGLHFVAGGDASTASNLQIDIFGAAAVGLSVLSSLRYETGFVTKGESESERKPARCAFTPLTHIHLRHSKGPTSGAGYGHT